MKKDDFVFNGEELGADQFADAAYYTGANSRKQDSLRLKEQVSQAKHSQEDGTDVAKLKRDATRGTEGGSSGGDGKVTKERQDRRAARSPDTRNNKNYAY